MFTLGDKVRPNILVSTDQGMFIVNRFDHTDSGISGFLLDHGNYNTVEADLTLKSLQNKKNPVIFDIGANIGTYASWIAMSTEAIGGKVYAFEPQRRVFQMLCGNLAINNIFNVYTYCMALGTQSTHIEIEEVDYTKKSNFGAFSLVNKTKHYESVNGSKQRIEMSTLDQFVRDNNIESVDFIKVDAEGMDIDVLEGGEKTLQQFKPHLCVEYINLGSTKQEDTMEEGKSRLSYYLSRIGYDITIVNKNIHAIPKN